MNPLNNPFDLFMLLMYCIVGGVALYFIIEPIINPKNKQNEQ